MTPKFDSSNVHSMARSFRNQLPIWLLVPMLATTSNASKISQSVDATRSVLEEEVRLWESSSRVEELYEESSVQAESRSSSWNPTRKYHTHEEEHLIKRFQSSKKLKSFQKLEKGWNGYDAKPLSDEVIERAIFLVMSPDLQHQPEIFPTARNSVQFEYHGEGGRYLEIEVSSTSYSSLHKNIEGVFEEAEGISQNEVIALVQSFNG